MQVSSAGEDMSWALIVVMAIGAVNSVVGHVLDAHDSRVTMIIIEHSGGPPNERSPSHCRAL